MSTSTEFHVGDRVRMKTVSPVMKIIAIERNIKGGIQYIECAWVSPKQKHYTDRFKPEELIHVDSGPDSN